MGPLNLDRKSVPDFLIPCSITVLLFVVTFFWQSFYAMLATTILFGITMLAYETTCPYCSKAFAKQSEGTEELSRHTEHIRKRFTNIVRNSYGEVMQTIEKFKVIPRHVINMRRHLVCIKCDSRWHRDFTKKELPEIDFSEDEVIDYKERYSRAPKSSQSSRRFWF